MFVVVSLLAFMADAQPKVLTQYPGWAFVATINCRRLPELHVVNLLKLSGISALTDGSVASGVQVANKDKKRALEILAEDAKRHGYHYMRIEGVTKKLGMTPDLKWTTVNLHVDLKNVLKSTELKSDANLRGMVREVLKKDQSNLFPKIETPYLSQIHFLPLEYVNDKGKWEIAYYGDVTFSSRTTMSYEKSYVAAWDGGKQSE